MRRFLPLLAIVALLAPPLAGHGVSQPIQASRFAATVAPQQAAALKREEELALEQAAKALRDMEALAKSQPEKDLVQSDVRILAEIRRLVAQRQAQRSSGAAAQQMQETQMSFNLQYLQLQNQMQNENRQYTAVSNIMKTKHDTVKNSISNIR